MHTRAVLPPRLASWKAWAAVLGLVAWFAVAGVATWAAELNTIDCGGDPDRCEPAVTRASHVGIAAQVVAFSAATALLVRAAARGVVGPEHVVVPGAVAVVIVLATWVAARSAVEAQYAVADRGPPPVAARRSGPATKGPA